jgi:putative transposase
MAKFKNKYRIESHRWQYWDYSAPASYFLTICTANRQHLFGEIIDGKMVLSAAGQIIAAEFQVLNTYHQRIILDEWVVMPNHIHCIITLASDDYDNGVTTLKPTYYLQTEHPNHIQNWVNPIAPPEMTETAMTIYRKERRQMLIPKIIGKFKQQTSKAINVFAQTPAITNWQDDYHDHVIKDLASYWNIRNYIINNPKNWDKDTFYDP